MTVFNVIEKQQKSRFGVAIFTVSRATSFFDKVDSQLPSRLMMLNRQPLKMKNVFELTKNHGYTIFEPLFQFNEAK